MKKNSLLVSGLFLICATTISCKKNTNDEKKYDCSYDLVYQPFSLGFTNLEPSDLDTLIIHKYLPNGLFNETLSIDTLVNRTYIKENGMILDYTNYIDGQYGPTGVGQFFTNADYKVYLNDIQKTITISQIKEPLKYYTFQSSEPCKTIDLLNYFGMPVATFESPYHIKLAWQYTEQQGKVLAVVK